MYHWSRRLKATFCSRETWILFQKCFKPIQQRRLFCFKATNTNTNAPQGNSSLNAYDESLKKLDNMNFLTAAKMLFTDPPKKKKFGLDFHLVQLFFACLPSLAVYLVAQYARYDMRIMEAELEQKKKKAEEIELNATKEKEATTHPQILEVRERLDKLEEIVKGIAVESKKDTASGQAKGYKGDIEKKSFGTEANKLSTSETSKPVGKDPLKLDSAEPRPAVGIDKITGASAQVPNVSPRDKIQDDKK